MGVTDANLGITPSGPSFRHRQSREKSDHRIADRSRCRQRGCGPRRGRLAASPCTFDQSRGDFDGGNVQRVRALLDHAGADVNAVRNYTAAFLGQSDAVANYLDREPEPTAEKAALRLPAKAGSTVLQIVALLLDRWWPRCRTPKTTRIAPDRAARRDCIAFQGQRQGSARGCHRLAAPAHRRGWRLSAS